ISTKPDSSTILKKCCHLFAYDPQDWADRARRGSDRAHLFSIFLEFWPRLWVAPDRPCYNSAFPYMAIISPFRAWRYDPERVPVQQVVTQSYDKTTPAMQERYYQASPYNLVRIIFGKRLPGDAETENVYTRAAASFQNWRQTGILRRDLEPSLYRYSQMFRVPGSAPGGQAQAERR